MLMMAMKGETLSKGNPSRTKSITRQQTLVNLIKLFLPSFSLLLQRAGFKHPILGFWGRIHKTSFSS
jgi:hypothetical protein